MGNSITALLQKKPYETQVVLLTALLATLRLFVALYVDTQRENPSAAELLTDATMLLVFGLLLVLGLRQANFQSVHPLFGLLIIILLGFNFLEFKGVAGTSRFNYYSGIYVVALVYAGRWLYVLLSVQLLFLVFLTFSTLTQASWVQFFYLDFEPDPTDFLFALVALGFLSFYLKGITLREVDKFEQFSRELNLKVAEAKTVNRSLVEQRLALQQAQEGLEAEVVRRTKTLEAKQLAIENYTRLNTTALQDPVKELGKLMDEFSPTDSMTVMLRVSHQELSVVFNSIKDTLEAQEELHRSKIRPS